MPGVAEAIDRRPIDQMILDVGPDAFVRLAALFQEETRGAIVEMRRRLDGAEWRELGRQAHSLKHSTASFGLIDLAAEALQLERAADAADAARSAAHFAALRDRTEATLAAFAALVATLAGAR